MQDVELSPSDFVALLNQTLDYAYPAVTIVGELANFRVSRNKWVYFDLKDDESVVKFFGTIYSLPGPLEDGMKLAVRGRPHMHDQYGFSVQVSAISPVGEGTIKKAANLLAAKLEAEGLFEPSRKRPVPYPPTTIGLIASQQSAAYADFIKVIGARYGGLHIMVYDAQVQGELAVADVSAGIAYFNNLADLPDVIVITRGGGSPEDLAAFSHEQVVRAVAASRVPTLVAIGHEIDLSLAELAADVRASTPSNAAELLVPNKHELAAQLELKKDWLVKELQTQLESAKFWLEQKEVSLQNCIANKLASTSDKLLAQTRLLEVLNPQAALLRGYALVRSGNTIVKRAASLAPNQVVSIHLADGSVTARVE